MNLISVCPFFVQTIDIKQGSFGNNAALSIYDYSYAASAYYIATLAVPANNNEMSEVALPANGLSNINKTGRTQFRLSGSAPIDFGSDVLQIYGGEDATYAPTLIVNYSE